MLSRHACAWCRCGTQHSGALQAPAQAATCDMSSGASSPKLMDSTSGCTEAAMGTCSTLGCPEAATGSWAGHALLPGAGSRHSGAARRDQQRQRGHSQLQRGPRGCPAGRQSPAGSLGRTLGAHLRQNAAVRSHRWPLPPPLMLLHIAAGATRCHLMAPIHVTPSMAHTLPFAAVMMRAKATAHACVFSWHHAWTRGTIRGMDGHAISVVEPEQDCEGEPIVCTQ